MQNPYRNLPVPLRYVVLAAMLFSALVLLEDYADYLINQFEFEYSWFTVSTQAISTYLVWVVISPLIARQASKLQVDAGNKIRKIALAIIVSLAAAGIHRFFYQRLFDLAYYADTGFMAQPFSEKNMQLLGTGWITSLIQYWIILMLFFSVIYYQRYLQKQKELNKAQLQALKMQLHPHFLFNTLHSISSLIDIDKKAAQKMVSQLGGLMRNTLEQGEKESSTLKEEFAYVKRYLDIEHVRFQDRLDITYDLPSDIENAIVPYLILQPAIENAIKHGIKDKQEDGIIQILARKLDENRIYVEIKDNGIETDTIKAGTGLGMKNVKNRLAQFFNEDYTLEFGSVQPNGFKVSIEIPYIETKGQ